MREGAMMVGVEVEKELRKLEELAREGYMDREELERRKAQLCGNTNDDWWKCSITTFEDHHHHQPQSPHQQQQPQKQQADDNEEVEKEEEEVVEEEEEEESKEEKKGRSGMEWNEEMIVGEVMGDAVGRSKEELQAEISQLKGLLEAGFVGEQEYQRRHKMLTRSLQSAVSSAQSQPQPQPHSQLPASPQPQTKQHQRDEKHNRKQSPHRNKWGDPL